LTENEAFGKQQGDLGLPTQRVIGLGNGTSLVFRRIPEGEFVMGSDHGYPDEYPRTRQSVPAFWICEMEVDNAQYAAFDPAHDSRYQDQQGKDHITPGYVGNHRRQPVVRVSWDEATAFCAWLSKKTGLKAALPTERQWEYAARAGAQTDFPWGDFDPEGKADKDFSPYANLADRDVRAAHVEWTGSSRIRARHEFPIALNYPLHEERWRDDWFNLNYVGQGRPNMWGLYDMIGNASEWTRTDYRPYPYAEDDGRNALSTNVLKVARGGSFASRPRDATLSYRLAYLPWQRVFDVGFRVVLEDDDPAWHIRPIE